MTPEQWIAVISLAGGALAAALRWLYLWHARALEHARRDGRDKALDTSLSHRVEALESAVSGADAAHDQLRDQMLELDRKSDLVTQLVQHQGALLEKLERALEERDRRHSDRVAAVASEAKEGRREIWAWVRQELAETRRAAR